MDEEAGASTKNVVIDIAGNVRSSGAPEIVSDYGNGKDYVDNIFCKLVYICTTLWIIGCVFLLSLLVVVLVLQRICGNRQSANMAHYCDYL